MNDVTITIRQGLAPFDGLDAESRPRSLQWYGNTSIEHCRGQWQWQHSRFIAFTETPEDNDRGRATQVNMSFTFIRERNIEMRKVQAARKRAKIEQLTEELRQFEETTHRLEQEGPA